MPGSPRAHVNLNLYLAECAVSWLEAAGDSSELWGRHEPQVAAETAIFRLQLAYRCHLADLCAQKKLAMEPVSATEAQERLQHSQEYIPEIKELVEREIVDEWLRGLLGYRYAEFGSGVGGMIASTADKGPRRRDPAWLREAIREMSDLVTRHRDSQQEY